MRPLPQSEPSGLVLSSGQYGELPVHVSSGSHTPTELRQTVLAEANLQSRQQSSLESSHCALLINLQVVGLQHLLSLQPEVPPQSHSSSPSTIPLPQVAPDSRVTSRLLVRQVDLTLLRPRAEQMLPMVQGEKCEMPSFVEGFMM